MRKHAFVHILKEEKTNMDQKAIALAAAKALDAKRGKDIVVLKVDEMTVITDYMVIATGRSVPHIFHEQDREYYQLERLWSNGTNEVEVALDGAGAAAEA